MKKFFFGALIGIVLPFLAFWLFIVNGRTPVRTKDPALPFESYLAHMALRAAVKAGGNPAPPFKADEPNLIAGARVYRAQCSVCHGLPSVRPNAIAKGLFPPPPQMYEAGEGVDADPISETYWIVKNGIRLTGMPGFADGLSETEMWQVSQLLSKGRVISEPVKRALLEQPPGQR